MDLQGIGREGVYSGRGYANVLYVYISITCVVALERGAVAVQVACNCQYMCLDAVQALYSTCAVFASASGCVIPACTLLWKFVCSIFPRDY
jgi:hypothetical protein